MIMITSYNSRQNRKGNTVETTQTCLLPLKFADVSQYEYTKYHSTANDTILITVL